MCSGPNSERFQPPKLWKAIGTGMGTFLLAWFVVRDRASAVVAGALVGTTKALVGVWVAGQPEADMVAMVASVAS